VVSGHCHSSGPKGVAGLAAVCFVMGVALSHRIEPEIRVETVTLPEVTRALKFIPMGLHSTLCACVNLLLAGSVLFQIPATAIVRFKSCRIFWKDHEPLAASPRTATDRPGETVLVIRTRLGVRSAVEC
jgi:hypothetical protein